MLPLNADTLRQVAVVSITYADGSLSLWAINGGPGLEPLNLSQGEPATSIRHFATQYIAPRGSTQLLLQILEQLTGQLFVLEPMIEGAPNERYIRQDLLSQVQAFDRQ